MISTVTVIDIDVDTNNVVSMQSTVYGEEPMQMIESDCFGDLMGDL